MKHRAAECGSKITCETLQGENYSYLCKQSNTMTIATEGSVIYPLVVLK